MSPDHVGAWLAYCDMQEDQEFGAWLIATIGAHVCGDGEATPAEIDRCTYKDTACGAWARFDEEGVIVGSIVEGHDAEFSERVQVDDLRDMEPDEAAPILCERWDAALQAVEDAVDDFLSVTA